MKRRKSARGETWTCSDWVEWRHDISGSVSVWASVCACVCPVSGRFSWFLACFLPRLSPHPYMLHFLHLTLSSLGWKAKLCIHISTEKFPLISALLYIYKKKFLCSPLKMTHLPKCKWNSGLQWKKYLMPPQLRQFEQNMDLFVGDTLDCRPVSQSIKQTHLLHKTSTCSFVVTDDKSRTWNKELLAQTPFLENCIWLLP